MLPSEPPGRFTLVNGNCSDKASGKSAAQNGRERPPKYKRRKVSAVRDFPPGCGRLAPQINACPPACSDVYESPIGQEGIDSGGGGGGGGSNYGASGLSEDLQGVVAATLRDEAIPVLLDGKFFLPSSVSVAVPNGDIGPERLVRKYPPRRKVSAVRDFPPNCGRKAPPLGEVEFVKVCASPGSGSSGAENPDSRTNDEAPTEKTSVDGGDSPERMETRGSDVITRKEVQDCGRNENTREETTEIHLEKIAEGVHDGELGKSNKEKSVYSVARDIVQSKKSVDSLASPKDKTKGKEMMRLADDPKQNVGDTQPKEPHEAGTSRKSKSKLKRRGTKVNGDRFQPESEKIAFDDESEMKVDKERERKHSEPSFEAKLVWWDHECETMAEKCNDDDDDDDDDDVEVLEGDLCKEMVVYSEVKDVKQNRENLELGSKKVIVRDDSSARKRKKLEMAAPPEAGQKTKVTARKKVDENGSKPRPFKKFSPKTVCQGTLDWDWEEVKSPPSRGGEDLALDFYYPPLGPDREESTPRRRVKEALRMYHTACRKYQKEEESKPKDPKSRPRVDLKAMSLLKSRNKFVNGHSHILGTVPGVEVGDRYQYRAELNVIGLHRASQGGIDYMNRGGKTVATSIVSSGGYSDGFENSDEVMTYTGQGGNVMNSVKQPEDQKLERGNLALKNSMDEGTPVRVTRQESSLDGKSKIYVYAGLYLVKKISQVIGSHGKLVFQFRLERIPGQPPLRRKEAAPPPPDEDEVCVEDISRGKEPVPIRAVNAVDGSKPPEFVYVTKMVYSDWYDPTPPEGCRCAGRCSDSGKCSCAVANGGKIPFNRVGAIVEMKGIVYECGPGCRCSASCHNRVSERGIRLRLEIFKTERTGWGVRSRDDVPSGSFVCEYLGELLREKDADQRTGNDEYLFDIGNNYNDNTLWDRDGDGDVGPTGGSGSGSGSEECFTIDAVEYGNVGRFVNHSCTPNLYAQNVMFDGGDKRIPRIMLFAAEDIPALRELTYHYNYTLDQVRDSNGNVKKKSCFCGSHDCTGRLY